MRIATILGRGIEGAGVTRFAIEFEYYVRTKTRHEIDVYALIDKRWPRENSQEHDRFINIKVKEEGLYELIRELNTYDAILYHSVPAKKGFSDECKLFFNTMVQSVRKPKRFSIQHDHKKQSLSRNIDIVEFNRSMDFIFTFDYNTAFAHLLREKIPNVQKKLIPYNLGIDFDSYKEFRKPFKLRKRRISYFGRFAGFKEPWRLYDLHPYIRKYKFITELRGIERSIYGYFKMIHGNEDRIHDCTISRDSVISSKYQKTRKPYVYGPYIRKEGLEEISYSLFGASFFNIVRKKEDVIKETSGRSTDFAQLEMIAVGLIPVYDYDWSVDTGTLDGRTYNEIPYFGLFLKKDFSNAQEIAEEMNRIANDKNLANRYIRTGDKIIRENFSTEIVFKEIVNNIKKRLK